MTTVHANVYAINEPRAEYGALQCVKTVKVQTQQTPCTSPSKTKARQIPHLTLSGQWLADAGFDVGTDVEIQVFKNGIKLSIEEKK